MTACNQEIIAQKNFGFVQQAQKLKHYLNLRSETEIKLAKHEADLQIMRENQRTKGATEKLQNNIAKMESTIDSIKSFLIKVDAKIQKYSSQSAENILSASAALNKPSNLLHFGFK